MSREGKFVKSTLILSIGTILPRLATFVTLPIITAGLTKEEYGLYDLILVLVSLLLPAVTIQVHAAAFRFLIEERDENDNYKRIVSSIFAVIIPLSIAALVILLFVFPHDDIVLRVEICVCLFVDIIAIACQWIIRGLQQNLKYSISAIANALVNMAICISCVFWLHMGLQGALIAQIAANAVTILILFFFGGICRYINLKYISITQIKEMLKYSWPLVPNNLSMWVMRVSDRFVVTAFMGVAANAVYSVANKLPQILNVAQNTFTMAWQENAVITSKDNDVAAYYSSMFSKMYDFIAGSLGLLIAFTPLLFKLLIRGDYAEAYFQIPILLLAMFFSTLTSYLGGIYVAFKSTKSIGFTTLAAAACNLIVDLALIKNIGLYAASGSTLISYLFLFIYRMIDIRKLVEIKYNYKRLLFVLCLVIVECVLCFMQKTILNVVNVVFGCIVFILLNREILLIIFHRIKRMKNHLK